MNFFEHQDRARRNTKYLILLLVLAVVALVAVTTLLIAVVVYFSQTTSESAAYAVSGGFWHGVLNVLSIDAILWVTIGVASIVFIGSGFRYLQLQSGGRAIAESVGGHLLLRTSQDADERKILNVVEEMAIASGTSVPPVYLLEDDAINAFAAGYHPQDAVIGITRGCIRRLNRDELQGVVAHEFSHIFHGDMRINMRLIALLYGILVIGLVGQLILRSTSHRGMVRSSSRNKSPGALLALGAGLLVIGYAGTFFGNLIKAAVSRQREFLADASAVKFTRNPEGISGALKKIGSVSGSELHSQQAAEFSHMYFSQGVKLFFNMMATHPPLEERIKRVQPNWDGKFSLDTHNRSISDAESTSSTPSTKTTPSSTAQAATLAATIAATAMSTANHHSSATLVEDALSKIAQPSMAHLDYARDRLAEIPETLKTASQEPFSARALIFGLLLDRDATQREAQLTQLKSHLGEREFIAFNDSMMQAAKIDTELRLPLVELSLTALKQLTDPQKATFLECLQLLIRADRKISLLEWSLYRIVDHNLKKPSPTLHHHSLKTMKQECCLLLSLIAHAGAESDMEANNAFNTAQESLGFPALSILMKNSIRLEDADKALNRLNTLKPLQKPILLKAMSQCIVHDGKITIAEAELFRALADGLDCPIPPLVI